MKRIEDLVFTDDYMFGAVMRDPDICKKVLERVLKIKIDHLEYPELQKSIKPYYESIETKNFLHYLYTRKATDELTTEIENKVISTKLNEIFRNDYLSMNLHDHDLIYKAKNEGRAEGKTEGIQETKIANAKALIMLNKLTIEDISKCCDLPLETVQALAKEINK